MDIRADEISRILRDQIKDYGKKVDVSETGTVLSQADGVARVYGLSGVAAASFALWRGDIADARRQRQPAGAPARARGLLRARPLRRQGRQRQRGAVGRRSWGGGSRRAGRCRRAWKPDYNALIDADLIETGVDTDDWRERIVALHQLNLTPSAMRDGKQPKRKQYCGNGCAQESFRQLQSRRQAPLSTGGSRPRHCLR